MPTYSKLHLTNSLSGAPIMISLSALPGNLIHSSGNNMDEVWIYASNNSTIDSITTFYWGSTAANNLLAIINIQAYTGLTLIIPGLPLNNNTVYAFTTYPSAVSVVGYVNRIS